MSEKNENSANDERDSSDVENDNKLEQSNINVEAQQPTDSENDTLIDSEKDVSNEPDDSSNQSKNSNSTKPLETAAVPGISVVAETENVLATPVDDESHETDSKEDVKETKLNADALRSSESDRLLKLANEKRNTGKIRRLTNDEAKQAKLTVPSTESLRKAELTTSAPPKSDNTNSNRKSITSLTPPTQNHSTADDTARKSTPLVNGVTPGEPDGDPTSEWHIPKEAWTRKLSLSFPEHKPIKTSAKTALKSGGMAYRLWKHNRAEKAQGNEPIVDPFDSSVSAPVHGVPMGGLGCGSIGRGWRGDFNRWQLLSPGRIRTEAVDANQFSVFVHREAEAQVPIARVLHPGPRPRNAALNSWQWGLGRDGVGGKLSGAERTTYHALFPRAWTHYADVCGVRGLHMTCRQVSPVIAGNYRESCVPTCVFAWRIENDTTEDTDVSLMLSWQNGDGSESDLAGGHCNESYRATLGEDGVLEDEDGAVGTLLLRHKRRTQSRDGGGRLSVHDDSCFVAVAGHAEDSPDANVTICPRWQTNSAASAKALWNQFSKNGLLTATDARVHGAADAPSEPGMSIGGAVAVKVNVPVGETRELQFVVSWHSRLIRFGSGDAYWRRHTKFYGREPAAIKRIVADTLLHWRRWEREIVAWQAPVLAQSASFSPNPRESALYAQALFNELYYLVEGGTVWTDGGLIPATDAQLVENNALTVAHVDVLRNSLDQLERPAKPAAGRRSRHNTGASERAADSDDNDSTTTAAATGAPAVAAVRRSADVLRVAAAAPGVGIAALRAADGSESDVGHFGVLSGFDERVYNQLHTHFHASWALVQLWPELELAVQRDMATAIFMADPLPRPVLSSGGTAARKVRGQPAFDFGSPNGAVWSTLNGLPLADTSQWLDLPSLFVLQVYRNYVVTHDAAAVRDAWPAVEHCMERGLKAAGASQSGDKLVLPATCDALLLDKQRVGSDSFYEWATGGTSVYSQGLWLGALQAAGEMAKMVELPGLVKLYGAALTKGQMAFSTHYWNLAGYFSYDSAGQYDGLIMAEQLCGLLYARSCGLPPIVEETRLQSALGAVFRAAVVAHGGGERGVALMAKAIDVPVANSSSSSSASAKSSKLKPKGPLGEALIGSTFSVAAGMRLVGLADEARTTVVGLLRASYSTLGLMFATPSVIGADGRIKGVAAGGLTIWSVKWADERAAKSEAERTLLKESIEKDKENDRKEEEEEEKEEEEEDKGKKQEEEEQVEEAENNEK